jgi:hypothetical protein
VGGRPGPGYHGDPPGILEYSRMGEHPHGGGDSDDMRLQMQPGKHSHRGAVAAVMGGGLHVGTGSQCSQLEGLCEAGLGLVASG